MTWTVTNLGHVMDHNNTLIGYFDLNGDVYLPARLDAHGNPYGAHPNGNVAADGTVIIETMAILGHVGTDGTVYNFGGLPMATVDQTGAVREPSPVLIGFVSPTLHGRPQQAGLPSMAARAAAAVILVILPA